MNTKSLTHEQIREKLREMRVDTGKFLPLKFFSFIVKNPDYDPEGFSQEIEDSEDEVNVIAEIDKECHRPEFDWVWNNTIGLTPRNSDSWIANHTKKCRLKMLPMKFMSACSMHGGGVRDYDNDSTMEKILDVESKYGEIYLVI